MKPEKEQTSTRFFLNINHDFEREKNTCTLCRLLVDKTKVILHFEKSCRSRKSKATSACIVSKLWYLPTGRIRTCFGGVKQDSMSNHCMEVAACTTITNEFEVGFLSTVY